LASGETLVNVQSLFHRWACVWALQIGEHCETFAKRHVGLGI